MKPRLPPSRSLQVSNPGPNGFVLLGPTPAPTRRWKLRLSKLRSTRAIVIILTASLLMAGAVIFLVPESPLPEPELNALFFRAEKADPTEQARTRDILLRQAYAGNPAVMEILSVCYAGGACGFVRSEPLGYAWASIAESRDPHRRNKLRSDPLSGSDSSPISLAAQLESQRVAVELAEKVRWRAKPDVKNQTAVKPPAGEKPPASTPQPTQETPAPLTGIAQLRAKAEQGNAAAQNSLALIYCNSANLKDYSKAIALFQNAALQGHAEAQFHLGVLYANGMGVPKDETKAVEWYKKSAALGNEDAISTLERLYNYRIGGPRNGANPSTFTQSTTPATNSAGKDAKLRHLATDDRPPTGALLVDRLRNDEGKGKLTLDNGRAEDAYVKLVRDGKMVVGFYVRSHGQATYSTIPDGTFWVMYCTGYGWDAKVRRFGRGRYARNYDLPLTFTTRKERDASGITTSTDEVTLTLHTVAGGNTTTTEMKIEDFDRY